MTNAVQLKTQNTSMEAIEKVLMTGDLSPLKPEERVRYYHAVCQSIDVNPTTKPFDYLSLGGKLVLYANKGCAEQLRVNRKISVRITSRENIDGVYVVTAEATGADGRVDSSTGAVPIQGLRGEALANAMMKAETKAKRRVTLSICSLNMLDESEVDSIPGAKRVDENAQVGAPGSGKAADLNKHFTPKPSTTTTSNAQVEDAEVVEETPAADDPESFASAEGGPVGASTASAPAQDLGSYLVKVGGPRSILKGKTFEQIGKNVLAQEMENLRNWFVTNKKPINSDWQEFFSKAEEYCFGPAS